MSRSNSLQAPADKQFRLGVTPSGMNTYTYPIAAYDIGKVGYWTDQGNNQIYGLEMPYAFPNSVQGKSWYGWNSTTDGSNITDYAEGGASRGTVKMGLDGTIDMTSLGALGITECRFYLPTAYSAALAGTMFQVRFAHPVSGLTLVGAAAGSWANDDNGAGYLWRFKAAGTTGTPVTGLQATYIRVPNNAANVPSLLLSRPRIVPHPGNETVTRSPAAVTPEPVGYPPEVAKWTRSGTMLRSLDLMRINFCAMAGDTLTSYRMVTSMPTDYLFGYNNAKFSLQETATLANEAGMGLHANINHRTDPSLIPTVAAQLALVDGPVAVEFGNENWNSGFIQNSELTIMGLRKGFGLLKKSSDAPGVAPVIQYPYKHTTTATTVAHVQNDLTAYNLPSYGITLFRARKDMPASGVALPTILNGTTTTVSYPAGTVILTNASRTLYVVKPGQTAPTGTPVTNTTYFQAIDHSVDDATAVAALVNWEVMLYNWECWTARWNYQSWMTRQLVDAVDAARAAVGKSKSLCILNVQGSNQVRTDVGPSGNESGWMLQFDNMWRRCDWIMSSLYVGESAISPSAYIWAYVGDSTAATDWRQQDRYDIYRTDITANQAVDAAANKILSANSRAYFINQYKAQMDLYSNRATIGLKAQLSKFQTDWNNANPGDIVTSVPCKFGIYEFGGPGNNANGSPDQAVAWRADAAYAAGYAPVNSAFNGNVQTVVGCFAKVGTQLYRCKGTATVGLSPANDSGPTGNWEAITSYIDPFNGLSYNRYCGLFNAVWHHPNMKLFIDEIFAMVKTWGDTNQTSAFYASAYTTIRAPLTSPGQAYGYRFYEDESLAVSPAHYALLGNKAAWDLLP